MTETLTLRRLKARLRNLNPDLLYQLRTESNGAAIGCVGFIQNPQTRHIVYVNTATTPLTPEPMYRRAESFTDYRGGTNCYVEAPRFAQKVIEALGPQVGDQVVMTGVMPYDPDPLEVGARGVVTSTTADQIYVQWENQRSLILLPSDPFEVLEPSAAQWLRRFWPAHAGASTPAAHC